MTPDELIAGWGLLSFDERVDAISSNATHDGFCSVLGFLSASYPDPGSQYEMARLFECVECLKPLTVGGTVETVAAYYYHVEGGGIETALRALADGLEGRRSVVITESGESAWANGDASELSKASVVSMAQFGGANRFERLDEALAAIRPDVLVYHA
ncbi:MAG: hypothetical protein J6D25_06585 [Eggerthellaceae bacterium]|nr:hypothetical protein [Eggerthellaceae bacterium]